MDNETPGPTMPGVPPGFVLVPKGGRPRKEARDAAIFADYQWRQQHFGERPLQAQKAIFEAWELAGVEASKGIGNEAHVRAALRRARERGLANNFAILDNSTGLTMMVESGVREHVLSVEVGVRAWVWVPGMTEADECRFSGVKVSAWPVLTEVCAAIAGALKSIVTDSRQKTVSGLSANGPD